MVYNASFLEVVPLSCKKNSVAPWGPQFPGAWNHGRILEWWAFHLPSETRKTVLKWFQQMMRLKGLRLEVQTLKVWQNDFGRLGMFFGGLDLRTILLTMKSTPCSWIYHRWDNVRIPNLLKNTFCWNIGLKHQFYTVVLTSKNPTVWTFLGFPLSKKVSISTCKPSSFKKFKWLMNPSIFFLWKPSSVPNQRCCI